MWHDRGLAAQLSKAPLSHASLGTTKLVVTCVNGDFGVLSGAVPRHAVKVDDRHLSVSETPVTKRMRRDHTARASPV